MTDRTPTEVVHLAEGPLRGTTDGEIRRFVGIPYAAPPVGDLRWRPPQPPERWTEPRDAVEYGPVCAQDTSCFPGFGHHSETEDCLYLNVYAPEDAGEPLPVMVWIPGGGFFLGGGGDYDPSAIVRDGNVVLVTFNYRVNVFGFFSHPAINAEGHANGNYGLMDQTYALQWVRRNIAAFGGDPDNVTIFGESAGAASVLAQMASPAAEGLFHKAISQSCSVAAVMPMATVESVAEVGVALATAAGCTDQTPENLRALTTKELLAANRMPDGEFGVGRFHLGPVVDGEVLPAPIGELFRSGRFHQVPFINGTNKDEFTWFQAMVELNTGMLIEDAAYPHLIGPLFEVASASQLLGTTVPPEAVPEILERYPLEKFENAARAAAAAVGDCGVITAGGRRTTRTVRRFVPRVYAYEFDVPDSPVAWPSVSFSYGSAHVQEVQFLFPGFAGGGGTRHELSGPQRVLAGHMVRYWTNFARYGDPNGEGGDAPYWPVYDAEADAVLSLTAPEPAVTSTFSATHHCDFWDGFYE
ncbi:carboxylesterase/lipase family protein [Actinocorallia sp. A-T 12471]|uniref:carboxylesterase/lipase family protein n=1 Tax=Actinocorallia sp. A-T 12471 TaxID=3089813 RepID=UPI0029D10442|nr:carboxylesterase/lipase family protein [Actinocorallia sp. A-T 12471]MDX6741680.1 carboxylesterase/lipase family protein [Actinocorallia sp. A-T 12471]